MKKYLWRYLIFWAPAVLVSYLFNNNMMLSHILLWFTAFFMLFGWSVNTSMAAYRYPTSVLAGLMAYAGFHLLIIMFLYMQESTSGLGIVLRRVGGILSFIPLDMLVKALKQYSPTIPHELYVTGFLVACCTVGFLVGLVRRQVDPDPYHPRIARR